MTISLGEKFEHNGRIVYSCKGMTQRPTVPSLCSLCCYAREASGEFSQYCVNFNAKPYNCHSYGGQIFVTKQSFRALSIDKRKLITFK